MLLNLKRMNMMLNMKKMRIIFHFKLMKNMKNWYITMKIIYPNLKNRMKV